MFAERNIGSACFETLRGTGGAGESFEFLRGPRSPNLRYEGGNTRLGDRIVGQCGDCMCITALTLNKGDWLADIMQ